MLKHKSLVMVSILVLVLAVVAMSCAPAKPVTPPAPPAPPVVAPPVVTPPVVAPPVVAPPVVAPVVEKPTSFESEKFSSADYGFSVRYPKAWTSVKVPYPKAVFFAKAEPEGKLSNVLLVDVRPSTSVKDAAIAALADYIAAVGMNVNPDVVSEKTITLADGKTSATEIELSANVLFMTKKGIAVGILKDGKAYVVLAGIDPTKMDLFKEISETLTLK